MKKQFKSLTFPKLSDQPLKPFQRRLAGGSLLGLALSLLLLVPVRAKEQELFETLKQVSFYFASGVGAWSTELEIGEDGSFMGFYHDMDMGSSGEAYPNGTLYQCSFQGKFSAPQKQNDYTYLLPVEEVKLERTPGEEETLDGIRYVYSEPYGLENAKELLLYLPGAPLEALPQEFLWWVGYAGQELQEGETLPMYGLYNPAGEQGFSGYEKRPLEDSLQKEGLDEQLLSELEAAIEGAKELEESLVNDPLTQQEMNQTASDLYMVWDNALNRIWKRLGEMLDADAFERLTQEELEWIEEKEAAGSEAEQAYADGSLADYARLTTLMERTRERVYQLIGGYGYQ